MMKRTLSALLSLSLALAYLSSAPFSRPAQAAPVGSVFGYTLTTANDPGKWIELNSLGLTPLEFPSPDDSLAEMPVSLGFTFPFFENSYSEVWVSTNGMLLLGEMAIDSSQHTTLPLDLLPNNLIAPLWDDLWVGGEFNGGKAYFQQFGSGLGAYTVIEWDQVTLFGRGSEPLSFEAVLFANGDIRFNYKTLTGTLEAMTVGIEDADGVDAYQVMYNEDGLSEGLTFLFTYPQTGLRLKAVPRSQGSFFIDSRAEFTYNLHNTGTEPEVIGFQPAVLERRGAEWQMSFYDVDGFALGDSDGDTYADTGSPLEPNETRPVRVRLSTSEATAAGDYNRWQVEFFAAAQPARRFAVQMQAAVPTPFAQNYYESGKGLTTLLVSPTRYSPGSWYFSSNLYNLNLTGMQGRQFESVFVRISRVYRTRQSYTSWGAPAPMRIYPAETPTDIALAALPDGSRTGIAYLTRKIDPIGLGLLTKIRFALFGPSGDTPVTDVLLTSNTAYRYTDSINIPEYSAPRAAVLDSGNFMLAWSENLQTQVEPEKKSTQDVWYAVLSPEGQVLVPPTKLTDSQPGLAQYSAPTLTELAGNRALLSYTATLAGNELRCAQIDGADGSVDHQSTLASGNGISVDGTQVDGGNVIMAWTDLESGLIHYAALDGAGSLLTPAQPLLSPNGRRMDFVSAASAGGQAVLTWGDKPGEEYLYYALVDGGGSLITPPTAFLRGSDPLTHRLQVNTIGYGSAEYNASLPSYTLFAPVGLQQP